MTGGGPYEKEATELRARLKAAGVVLIVAGGERGTGFEIAIVPEFASRIPAALREVADKMEADILKLTTATKPS